MTFSLLSLDKQDKQTVGYGSNTGANKSIRIILMHLIFNATSDWITSKICEYPAIYCRN